MTAYHTRASATLDSCYQAAGSDAALCPCFCSHVLILLLEEHIRVLQCCYILLLDVFKPMCLVGRNNWQYPCLILECCFASSVSHAYVRMVCVCVMCAEEEELRIID